MLELLQDAHVWVFIGVLIFFGVLFYAKVPGMVANALDARGAKIQAELDQALRLRQEAEALLAQIKLQREAAERQAAEMIANAQSDAKRMAEEAAVKLEETIVRRQKLAERKIATAEAQAAAEVKAAAAELAANIAESVLVARLKDMKSDPLVDRAVGEMAGKLQ